MRKMLKKTSQKGYRSMDDFKKVNVNMATKYDFNAPSVVKLRDRSKIHKMLNRYSRRKLKHKIESEK